MKMKMPQTRKRKTPTQRAQLNFQLLSVSDLTELKALVRQGADLSHQSPDGETVLIKAFADLEMVRYVVTHGVPVNTQTTYGDTALLFAAGSGKSDVVEFLLQNGADPNLLGRIRGTALMYAARRDERRCVELLLEHGADIALRNRQGQTALDIAIERGHSGLAEFLAKQGAPSAGSLRMIRQTARRQRNGHALIPAVKQGDVAQVQQLLTGETNPDATDEYGRTALGQAVFYEHEQIVALLLRHGARLDALQHTGESLLGQAAGQKDSVIVRHLLAAGANPNIIDREGRSPLHRALLYLEEINTGHFEIVQLLLEAGADPNVPDGQASLVLDRVQDALARLEQQPKPAMPPNILAALQRYYAEIETSGQEWKAQALTLARNALHTSKTQQSAVILQLQSMFSAPEWPTPSSPILTFLAKTYHLDRSDAEQVHEKLADLRSELALGQVEMLQALVALLQEHGAHTSGHKVANTKQPPLHCLRSVFRHREIPSLLYELYELETELQSAGQSLGTLACDLLDYVPDEEDRDRPPNCLPFASGVNGTGFALLSTGTSQSNLSKSSVVMYGMECEPPARVVANTFRQFLSLLLTVRHTDMINEIERDHGRLTDSEARLADRPEHRQKVLAVCHKLQQRFRLSRLPNPSHSISQCRQKYREVEQWDPSE